MTGYMGRTLTDAIETARKREGDLPHIVQVLPSDYDTIIMADRIAALEADNERAWRERNTAYAKVKAWESVVYIEHLPLRAVAVNEWGPGEGGQTTVPDITPKKLTDLLAELSTLRAALEAKQ